MVPVKHGRTGNNLFQLAEAFHLSKLHPSIKLEPFSLDEIMLARVGDDSQTKKNQHYETAYSHSQALELIKTYADSIEDHVIRLDYLFISPDLAVKEKLFLRTLVSNQILQNPDCADTVIHVRAGDIWKSHRYLRRPTHPDYSPLPLDYYKLVKEACEGSVDLITETGGPSWYRKSIQKITKPTNNFVGRSLAADFNSFLTCSNLVLSISTLSWLASLVGESNLIHYPKLGLFDSRRRRDLNFTPAKPAIVYEFENHVWSGGTKVDKEWLIDSKVRITSP